MTEEHLAKTAKVKRRLKDNASGIVAGVVVFVFLLALFVIIQTKIDEPQQRVYSERTEALYEITEVDVLAIENFTSDQVSVMGIVLGDSLSSVIERLGIPDNRNDFPEDNIANLEYSSTIGLNATGLIIHFQNDKVKRISMLPPFNTYLHGETKVTHTKAEIYAMFGVPDEFQHIPVTPNSALLYRLLTYRDHNIEITMRKNLQTGLNLVSSG